MVDEMGLFAQSPWRHGDAVRLHVILPALSIAQRVMPFTAMSRGMLLAAKA